MLGEEVPSHWLGDSQLFKKLVTLEIMYDDKKVQEKKIETKAVPHNSSLVFLALRVLVIIGITKEDIPEGILPPSVLDQMYNIWTSNVHIPNVGLACSSSVFYHTYNRALRIPRSLPLVLAPGEDPPPVY